MTLGEKIRSSVLMRTCRRVNWPLNCPFPVQLLPGGKMNTERQILET